ncbi:MAG: CopD family protein [Ectothiorhodospiraceae bacterium]|nr:CopD family protein [Chromatiales bacterium]MCP5153336.1 CopD family protein [Ectothiorhodospiraceae bacterium]
MSISLALHVIAAVVWVGGLFFAYTALRPSAASVLEPPQRLALWRAVFDRFFRWVWVAVVVLLVTGYGMVFGFYGGMGAVGVHVHVMQATGIAMMLLFLHVWFAPYRRLGRALDAGDVPAAAGELDRIRRIVRINVALGLITIAAGSGGRFLALG